MNTEDKTVTNETKLKPKGTLFRSKPRWSFAVVVPFLAIIGIYSSGRSTFFLLSAIAVGLLTFLLIAAWLWFGHTVTLGKNYVKVRNGLRVHTFTPNTELTAVRVSGSSPVLFLKQAQKKAMINTLNDEQLDIVTNLLHVKPEEATIAINGQIDKDTLSETGRDILPFWIKNPVAIGLIVGFIMIVLVVAGVITYVTLLE